MKHSIHSLSAYFLIIASAFLLSCNKKENQNTPTVEVNPTENTADDIQYSSGGFSSIVINKPINECFNILTNVNIWPKINLGVTKTVTPEGIVIKKGSKFNETIISPELGNWTNEWTVKEFDPGKRFVIEGRDKFSKEIIYARLTYTFTEKTKTSTVFKRTIEVSLDDEFVTKAKPAELQALYGFLGSQWLMASHLKKFVENYNPEK